MAVLLAQSVAWPVARQSNAHRLAMMPAQPHAVRGAPVRRLLSGVHVRQRRAWRAAAAEVQRAVELVDATVTAESRHAAWAVLGLGQAMVRARAAVLRRTAQPAWRSGPGAGAARSRERPHKVHSPKAATWARPPDAPIAG